MFNIGPPELLVILVLALVLVGPEQLPGIIRKSAKTFAEIKKVSTSLRTEFVETLEAETKDIKDAFSDAPLSFPDNDDPKAISPTFTEEDKAIIDAADEENIAQENDAAELSVESEQSASDEAQSPSKESDSQPDAADITTPQASEISNEDKAVEPGTNPIELDQSP